MLFTSATFVVFFAIVLLLWHLLPFRFAKFMLLVASLIFYGYWYPPLIVLLLFSGLVDYIAGARIVSDPAHRRSWLAASLATNLGVLFFFKYSAFAVDNLNAVFGLVNVPLHVEWSIILPLGISFYTFQSMSYTIDIYKGNLKPTRSFADFFMYLSFFPQLVAGPIVRAVDFLPQVLKRHPVTYADVEEGVYRITRGFFLKMVIANNIAGSVQTIFAHDVSRLDLWAAWMGALFFGIQIFCDFAGYSDIAIGLARLFGLRLLENFNNPYTAGSLQDFWRRWHISLSTWFRDYVYVPLGGNRTGQWRASANLFVVFVISGIWHGANWTFLLWGAMHGLALLLERRLKNFWRSRQQPAMPAALATTLVLIFVVFAWVPFRAPSIAYTFQYWQQMISGSLRPQIPLFLDGLPWLLLYIGTQTIMLLRERNPGLSRILSPKLEMWVFFALIVLIPSATADFIYFDF